MVIIFGSNFFVEEDVSQEKSSTNNNSIESNSEYQVSEDTLVVIEDIPEISDAFQNESIKFSTPMFDGKISKVGGYIFDVRLKEYSDSPNSNNPTRIMQTGEFISNTIIKAKDLGIPKKINFNYNNSIINLVTGTKQFDLTSKFGSVTIQKSFMLER